MQVSAVSDQVGMQDIGANAADFDDDEGGGMVSLFPLNSLLTFSNYSLVFPLIFFFKSFWLVAPNEASGFLLLL